MDLKVTNSIFDSLEAAYVQDQITKNDFKVEDFLTIDELIAELEEIRIRSLSGGNTIVHLIDRNERDKELDYQYAPLGVLWGQPVHHIKDVKAALVISRTKDFYRVK